MIVVQKFNKGLIGYDGYEIYPLNTEEEKILNTFLEKYMHCTKVYSFIDADSANHIFQDHPET